jgi:hypothetical protein
MPFSRHDNWTRAWVTQEFLLAKRVRLMADDAELLMEYMTALVKGGSGNVFAGDSCETVAGDRVVLKGVNLFHLLHLGG